MLADMKEQMKEQQAQSDRDLKQAALDRDNIAREQEALKQHNDKLQTPETNSIRPHTLWSRKILFLPVR